MNVSFFCLIILMLHLNCLFRFFVHFIFVFSFISFVCYFLSFFFCLNFVRYCHWISKIRCFNNMLPWTRCYSIVSSNWIHSLSFRTLCVSLIWNGRHYFSLSFDYQNQEKEIQLTTHDKTNETNVKLIQHTTLSHQICSNHFWHLKYQNWRTVSIN